MGRRYRKPTAAQVYASEQRGYLIEKYRRGRVSRRDQMLAESNLEDMFRRIKSARGDLPKYKVYKRPSNYSWREGPRGYNYRGFNQAGEHESTVLWRRAAGRGSKYRSRSKAIYKGLKGAAQEEFLSSLGQQATHVQNLQEVKEYYREDRDPIARYIPKFVKNWYTQQDQPVYKNPSAKLMQQARKKVQWKKRVNKIWQGRHSSNSYQNWYDKKPRY